VGGLVAALAADPDAMILAGGHSLLPALALRGQRSGRLVDIGRIAALKRIELDGGAATIGAGVTLSAILASPVAAGLSRACAGAALRRQSCGAQSRDDWRMSRLGRSSRGGAADPGGA
jgi:CO/xanthine dehydrogenase FAD-binding subunit